MYISQGVRWANIHILQHVAHMPMTYELLDILFFPRALSAHAALHLCEADFGL